MDHGSIASGREVRAQVSIRKHRLDPGQILSSLGEVLYEWRLDTDALAWGENVCAVLPVNAASDISTGRRYAALLDRQNVSTRFDAVMRSGSIDRGEGVPYQVQYCLAAGDDGREKLWIEDTGRWFAGGDGRPFRAHGVVRVINERHEHEAQLAYLSHYDALTGEMNRWRLTEQLTITLDECHRYRASCGFLLVAIDHLGRYNEAFGFDIADEVIAAVGKRLREKMRAGDLLGRYSGTKFGIVLKSCTADDLAAAAERLLAAIRETVVETSVGPVAITATIGGITAPRYGRTLNEVLARAHEALADAKRRGPGTFAAYRTNPEREVSRQANIRATDEIVRALNERRILPAFEPVVFAASRSPAFYECLLRIRGNDDRIITATEIMPVAERLGLVRLLDHRMLELAVAELAADPDLRLSLNVSPASTMDPDWWTSLAAQLRQHAQMGERLMVEITEMTAIADVDQTRGFVTRVKDLGCRLAIDDFGAGYTSFRNLRKLGIDVIKIDGAFVRNLSRVEDDRNFVRTMIELARALKVETVAEWVQDEQAAAMLAHWGCTYLQGELIGLAALERDGMPSSSAAGATPAGRVA